MRTNKILTKWQNGEKASGVFLTFPSKEIVEFIGQVGLDYVNLDGEHGSFTLESIDDHCRIADIAGVTPTARVPNIHPSTILQFLDRGVMGIVGPHIDTMEEAQTLADSCRYYPAGKRSWGAGRGNHYGDPAAITSEELGIPDKTAFMDRCNNEMIVIAQIESVESLNNLPEMLTVEGIDAWTFGPNDLAQSMGYIGQPDHPEVIKTMAKTDDIIRASGKAVYSDITTGLAINYSILDSLKNYAATGTATPPDSMAKR